MKYGTKGNESLPDHRNVKNAYQRHVVGYAYMSTK